MRIISDFKDYYDSALSFGSDPNLIYMRKEEVLEFEARWTDGKLHMPRGLDQALRVPLEFVRQLPHAFRKRERCTYRYLEIPITTKVIGFCGHLYAAIEIDGIRSFVPDQVVSQLSDEFLQPFGTDQKDLERLFQYKPSASELHWYRSWGKKPLTSDFWEASVADFADKRYDDVFIETGVPVFKLEYIARNKPAIVNTVRCTLNPHLKTESFQKVRPPAEAFQEISMYLGNQLARQMDPVSQCPDDIMRDEKGFDEWSFRRHKEEDRKYLKKEGTE